MNEGLMLMVAGMGTVFVFLTVLVIAMTSMSRLVMHMQPAGSAAVASPEGGDDEIAAITAAIRKHRSQ